MAEKRPRGRWNDRIELALILLFVVLVLTASIWMDDEGGTALAQSTIDANIEVYASAMPNTGWAPLTVYFSAFGSRSPGNTIARYEWDLDGNGAFEYDATDQGGYASYLYSKPGEYTISLRVTDANGNTNTASTVITVRTPASSSVDYWSIFNDTQLRKVTISLTESSWQTMWADIETKTTVPADVNIFGETLRNVGFRMRGQFSMRMSGDKKPWKIDTDYYVANQEYHNLKQLMFINNIGDPTMMQEKLAYEMMQFAGLPASFVCYVELWIDLTDDEFPAQFWGIYTMVERIDQKFIGSRFGADAKGGNLYKASHAQRGPMDLIYYGPNINDYPTQNGNYAYGKVNNEEEADYSDVVALIYAIDGAQYDTPEDWAAAVEQVLNIDNFLRYMAVTDMLANWDSYPYTGNNYYLFYNEPAGRFEWLPWDLTWGGNTRHPLFEREETGMVERAPLLDKAFQVERYRVQYAAYLDLLTRYYFTPQNITARAQVFYNMISPRLAQGGGDKMYYGATPWFTPDDFRSGVDQLANFTYERDLFIRDLLSTDDWRQPVAAPQETRGVP